MLKAERTHKPLSILVVEDEFLIAKMTEGMLQALGCRVVGPAGSVARAIALIEAADQSLDGAFIDVNLNGALGYPVADALAARDVPFAFVTGYASEGIDPSYGAAPVLAKPLSAAAIGSVVVNIFGNVRRQHP